MSTEAASRGRGLGVVAAVFPLVATGVVGTELWARAAIERSEDVAIWREPRTVSAFVATA